MEIAIEINATCENCTHYARGIGCNLTFWQDYYSGYGFESEEDDFCSRWEEKQKMIKQ